MSESRKHGAPQQRASVSKHHSLPLEYRSPRPPKVPVKGPPGSSQLRSSRKAQWIIGGIAVYAFTAYGTYLYKTYSQTVSASRQLDVPDDVSDRYDQTAKGFDDEVNFAEKIMGLLSLRKDMAEKARGHVLEVSAGTGRNFGYYPLEKCKSLTVVDRSAPMIEVAWKKFADLHPEYKNITFQVQDAARPVPCPSPLGFDTVIQSMGLCSAARPAELLQNLAHLTNQEHGRILLLEHGRSHYPFVNTILDSLAPAHADKHGCWWNKDIGKIIEASGLEVVESRRYHLGTTWWFELRPRRRA